MCGGGGGGGGGGEGEGTDLDLKHKEDSGKLFRKKGKLRLRTSITL